MQCPQCSGEVPGGARFCPTCGHELVVVGDQRRIATVLFGDLVGFTSVSETLDPEQVKAMVDRCFERLVTDIETFGGRVDKIMGDAIVALFGAPIAHEDDAERAVRAGLRMQETMSTMAGRLGEPIQMRIGVNTGEVLVGAVHGGREYTAMGDVVNTASRLQEAAEPGTVLVGPRTEAATRDVVDYQAVDPVVAKGKRLPVEAFVARRTLAPPGQRIRRNRAPMIGRETELGLLTAVSTTAIDRSRAALLLVHGEAGMGKSRLATETAAHAASCLGALVLEGRCVPYGEANVWWPIAEAVRSAVGLATDASTEEAERVLRAATTRSLERAGRLDELDRTVAGLQHLLGNDSALRAIEAGRAREEVLRATVAIADGLTAAQPLFVSISDLHWADQEVLELIDALLVRLARRPVVIMGTARRSLRDRWVPAPEAANAVMLHLDPLDTDSSQRLLAHLGEGAIDPDLGEMLVARSGGNPFYLEELVSLVTDAGVRSVDGLLATETGDLPTTLRGLVAARLDALAPIQRQILDDAAVLGRRNRVEALVRMAEVKRSVEAEQARGAVEQLAAREFFIVEHGAYAFRSDVIREVAYSTLTKADRARSHAGIALWLEDNEDASREYVVDQLAGHYAAAAELVADIGAVSNVPHDVRARAVHWLRAAWTQAAADVFPANVIALTSRALELMAADDPERPTVLRARAAARADRYETDEALHDLDEAGALVAAAGGDARETAELALVRAEALQNRGQLHDALAVLDDAHERFAALGHPAGCAQAQRQRGMVLIWSGEFAAADAALEDALRLFEELGDRRGSAWSLQHLAWSAYISGRVEEADHRLHAAMETFDEIGDPGGRTWTRGLLAWVRFHQGLDDEARELAIDVEGDARDRGEVWGEAMMVVLRSSIELWVGRTDVAVDLGRQAVDLFAAIEDRMGGLQARCGHGRARLMAGDVEGGLGELRDAIEVSAGSGGDQGWMPAVAMLNAAVQIGDVAIGQEAVRSAPGMLDPATVGGADRVAALAIHLLQLGEPGAAAQMLGQAGEVRGYDDAARALLAASSGDLDGAAAAADSVREHAHTYLDIAHAEIGRALALGAVDRIAEARQGLSVVMADVDATGDRVAQAVLRLVDAAIAEHGDRDDAPSARTAADTRLRTLGLAGQGWHTIVRSALAGVRSS